MFDFLLVGHHIFSCEYIKKKKLKKLPTNLPPLVLGIKKARGMFELWCPPRLSKLNLQVVLFCSVLAPAEKKNNRIGKRTSIKKTDIIFGSNDHLFWFIDNKYNV